jgi:2-dehydro-3-deoxygluconokinase
MTLGEAMVVFDPASPGLLRHVDGFVKRVGGAELNVAVALARLGHRVGWAGALGADEFGAQILGVLRGEGVAVDRVRVSTEAATGVYFKERGALGRLRVAYYRAGSAASRLRFDDLDLDHMLDASVLHLTGITPALSDACADLVARLAAAAVDGGTLLSVDANLRWRLLGDRDPRVVLAPLVERADLLFVSGEEADALFGAHDPDSLRDALDGLRASTIVMHDADGAWAVEADGLTRRPAHRVTVVDTVGAGDAFVAGFLSGRMRGWNVGECLELGNACGACAVTLPGDAESMPTERDALALLHARAEEER